ncbi:MAG: hypothetical protein KAQ66_06530, partial [Rhodospirillaceae bacterium]|nr:hypothetical protein [Rhodospirillaceae bacterium]
TTIINDTLIVNDALSNDIRTFSTTTNNANIYFDSNIGFTQSGTANPNVVQGLMITDTSWNDQLVGGSIISAQ